MGAAARVTSCRGAPWQVLPGPALRDASRDDGWRGPAARAGGDVCRCGQVAVASERAVRTGEDATARPGTRMRRAGQVEDVPARRRAHRGRVASLTSGDRCQAACEAWLLGKGR